MVFEIIKLKQRRGLGLRAPGHPMEKTRNQQMRLRMLGERKRKIKVRNPGGLSKKESVLNVMNF